MDEVLIVTNPLRSFKDWNSWEKLRMRWINNEFLCDGNGQLLLLSKNLLK